MSSHFSRRYGRGQTLGGLITREEVESSRRLVGTDRPRRGGSPHPWEEETRTHSANDHSVSTRLWRQMYETDDDLLGYRRHSARRLRIGPIEVFSEEPRIDPNDPRATERGMIRDALAGTWHWNEYGLITRECAHGTSHFLARRVREGYEGYDDLNRGSINVWTSDQHGPECTPLSVEGKLKIRAFFNGGDAWIPDRGIFAENTTRLRGELLRDYLGALLTMS